MSLIGLNGFDCSLLAAAIAKGHVVVGHDPGVYNATESLESDMSINTVAADRMVDYIPSNLPKHRGKHKGRCNRGAFGKSKH